MGTGFKVRGLGLRVACRVEVSSDRPSLHLISAGPK